MRRRRRSEKVKRHFLSFSKKEPVLRKKEKNIYFYAVSATLKIRDGESKK
ncbi:MAG: hypothetical protein U9O85_09670 [Euryarchaeota archaeon]|nr:hypothetical protein [Euryarchaeota archaeon]